VDELLDYDEQEEQEEAVVDGVEVAAKKEVKGTYVSIHSSGFRDFLLKPELLRAIVDCGFEHPSEGNTCCETSYLNTTFQRSLLFYVIVCKVQIF